MEKRKRLLEVTPGNLRQSHLYVCGHYDFFPPDCIGPPRKARNATEGNVEFVLDGLSDIISTDIGTDAKTGKPRRFFRGREWVRRFFTYHVVTPGTKLALERLGERRYHLSVERPSVNGHRPTAAEFFAGIGLAEVAAVFPSR